MNNNTWVPYEEYLLRKDYFDLKQKEFEKAMLWGIIPPDNRTEEEKYRDTLKWAWVEIGFKREMLFVSNTDMKAYKTEGYNVVVPLEQVEYSRFERWCTSFDL